MALMETRPRSGPRLNQGKPWPASRYLKDIVDTTLWRPTDHDQAHPYACRSRETMSPLIPLFPQIKPDRDSPRRQLRLFNSHNRF